MEEIIKHINDTNASYRTYGAGDAKNTDLFLDNEHYKIFSDEGEQIKVRFRKENLQKAILFISSILPRKYDNSSKHETIPFSTAFVFEQLSILDAVFSNGETHTQTWNIRKGVEKKNGTIDDRFYFNGLIEDITYTYNGETNRAKFTIRNYLAGGHSNLHMKKADDGIFDVWITNTYDYKYNFTLNPSSYDGDLSPIILYGPPGTGKTFTMQNDYISKFDEDNRYITTFHQSFTYEEFVEGLKPILNNEDDSEGDIKYKIEKGVLSLACERAAQMAGYATLADCISDSFVNRQEKLKKAIDDKKLVLLCIDEINRGNVASIFGDLISLIEQSKRLGKKEEMTVTLPYSKEKFGVPSNLLIVGTMNTADRSIQLLDSALRRRFKFKELLPDYSVFDNFDSTLQPTKDKAKNILKRINNRIRCLLNKDNQIGHSYLMFAETDKDIFNAIITKIIPLLEEYFYDDIQKVRFVLNENEKTQHPFYVEDKEAKKAYEEYVTTEDIDSEGKSFFGLNDDITSIKDENVGNYLKHLLGENE